jgi:segregation and condensation protein B
MSLKAKLEAVIYASEEPVTLAQLASLFAADALEWKAQQDADAAAAKAEANPPLPMIDEGLQYLGLEQTPAFYAAEVAAEPTELTETGTAPAESASEAESVTAADSAQAESAAPEDPESEAKRQARARDREVRAILRQILDAIIADYAHDDRGVEIREIAGGFRMATKPECHDAVRLFIKSLKPALKLSLPALETLAVVAYKQPVTAPEVNEIRGVESGGVLGSLLSRKLIATAGRKQVIGRPILYKTTKEFLLRFGLKDVAELPSMEEFEKMAAIELSEPGTESETDESAQSSAEFDENSPEDGGESNGNDSSPEHVVETQSHEPSSTTTDDENPGVSELNASGPDDSEPASPDSATQGANETVSEDGSRADPPASPEASNEHSAVETASHD